MESITIQVDSHVAKAYREAEPEQQQQIQILLNVILTKVIHQKSSLTYEISSDLLKSVTDDRQ